MINISNKIRAPMGEAGNMGNFYDKKLWTDGIKAAASSINEFVGNNVTEKELMANKAFRAHHYGRIWYNRANFYKQWKKTKEMKKVKKFLEKTEDAIPMNALNDAYAALKYNPKKSKQALEAVATASGKTPREVKTIFGKVFKFK